jgi:putative AdoMet-dependent methyltransferase
MKNIPLWQYDESNHPGEDFDFEAEVYDEKWRKLRDVQKENKELLSLLNLQPDQTMLEIGAGTGEFAIAAAEHCSKVLAVDLSQCMLKLAEKKAKSKGLKNIEYIHGGFLTYEHRGEPVDIVVSQLALHYLPDFWKQIALFQLSKIMKPTGKLLLYDSVYSFEIADYEEFFNKGIAQMASIVGDDTFSTMIDHIKSEYSTIDWIMEGLIKRAGFRIERADYQKGVYATYLCTKISQLTR